MKMMKRILWICIFGLIVICGISAQEKQAFFRPTVAMGFASATSEGYTESGFAPSFDIDFVNNFGLTLGLSASMLGNAYGSYPIAPFGFGYTYDGEKWCAGGKLMFVTVGNWGVGLDFSGTYWINNNLGITGIMDIFFPKDITIFSLRVGVSYKM